MPGLMNYGAGLQNTQTKQGLLQEEGGSPINVLSTITPDSLTKMMQRIGGGIGAGASPSGGNPSAGLGQGPGKGLEKSGDKPLVEQQKFLGTNKAGFKSMDKYRDVFMPGATHVQENFKEANSGTNLALNAILPGSGWIKQLFK